MIKLQVRRAVTEKYFVEQVFGFLMPWRRHHLCLATWANFGPFRTKDQVRRLDVLRRRMFTVEDVLVRV